MWFIIIVLLIIGALYLFGNSNSNNQKVHSNEELMELAKKATGPMVSKLGRISQIPDLNTRAKEYSKVRAEVLARKHEPVGRLLQGAFNTYTDADRDLVESIGIDE